MSRARRAVPILVLVGIGLNLAGGIAVEFLRLPLYLDTAGTMLVAVAAGPWWGAFTGIASNALLSLGIPGDLWFGIANAAIGITVGIIVRRRGFKDYLTPLLAALAASFVGLVAGALIATLVFDAAGSDSAALTGALWQGFAARVFGDQMGVRVLTEVLDKLIAIYIVFYITRMIPDLAPDPPAGFVDPIPRAEQ